MAAAADTTTTTTTTMMTTTDYYYLYDPQYNTLFSIRGQSEPTVYFARLTRYLASNILGHDLDLLRHVMSSVNGKYIDSVFLFRPFPRNSVSTHYLSKKRDRFLSTRMTVADVCSNHLREWLLYALNNTKEHTVFV